MSARIVVNTSGAGKITVNTTPKNRISINNGVATSGGGASYFTQLRDVDATNIANNNVVVYDEVSGKFKVEEVPIVNGGDF